MKTNYSTFSKKKEKGLNVSCYSQKQAVVVLKIVQVWLGNLNSFLESTEMFQSLVYWHSVQIKYRNL